MSDHTQSHETHEPPANQLIDAAPVLSVQERDRRWSRLRALMAALDLDGMIIGSYRGRERHEAYVIDDEVDGCVIFPADGEPTVLTLAPTFLSRTRQAEERGLAVWASDYRLGRRPQDIVQVLEEKHLETSRVGVVGLSATSPGELDGIVPYAFWIGVLGRLPRAEFVDVTESYGDLWLVRSDEELELLRYAARVSEQVVTKMTEASRPGVLECDVYAAIVNEVYANGCYLKYPYLSLHSGPENIGWGPPRWTLRAEPPRALERGDMVQAEIHTCYGGMEAQVQGSVAIDPISEELQRCEEVARQSYEIAVAAVRPGMTMRDLIATMEAPLKESGCWAKTPFAHTLTWGSFGFSLVNREQLRGTAEAECEISDSRTPDGVRLDLELKPGMPLELEPNASLGFCRVNIGGVVIVTESGCEELNDVSTRVQHIGS